MPTIHQMAENVRQTWLNNPLSQKPTPHQLYGKLFAQTQRFYNQISRTGKPWAVGQTRWQVIDGMSDYNALSFPSDMGKVLLVYAQDTNASYYPLAWEIPTVDIQNIFAGGGALRDWYWFGYGGETVGLYRQSGGDWRAKIFPVPRLSREYTVLYTVGDWMSTASIEDAPLLSEHHPAIEVATAFSLLPDTEWVADKEENRKLRMERGEFLRDDRDRFEKDFASYISSLRQPRTVRMSSGISFD